jgi:hypothetical protein
MSRFLQISLVGSLPAHLSPLNSVSGPGSVYEVEAQVWVLHIRPHLLTAVERLLFDATVEA